MVRKLLIGKKFFLVEIDDSAIDDDVWVYSIYHAEPRVFPIDTVVISLKTIPHAPDDGLQKYRCNSDTFDKFKDNFIEVEEKSEYNDLLGE